jgi:hypothetical protein
MHMMMDRGELGWDWENIFPHPVLVIYMALE